MWWDKPKSNVLHTMRSGTGFRKYWRRGRLEHDRSCLGSPEFQNARSPHHHPASADCTAENIDYLRELLHEFMDNTANTHVPNKRISVTELVRRVTVPTPCNLLHPSRHEWNQVTSNSTSRTMENLKLCPECTHRLQFQVQTHSTTQPGTDTL